MKLADYRHQAALKAAVCDALSALIAVQPIDQLADYLTAHLWVHGFKVVPIEDADVADEEIHPRASSG